MEDLVWLKAAFVLVTVYLFGIATVLLWQRCKHKPKIMNYCVDCEYAKKVAVGGEAEGRYGSYDLPDGWYDTPFKPGFIARGIPYMLNDKTGRWEDEHGKEMPPYTAEEKAEIARCEAERELEERVEEALDELRDEIRHEIEHGIEV